MVKCNRLCNKKEPQFWLGFFWGRRGGLESHFFGTFGADAAFDAFGHGQLAPASAAFSLVMDFDLIGGEVVDMAPEPVETTGGGGVGGDFGFATVTEGAIGEDGAEEGVTIFIIRTSQDGDEVRGVGLGLTDLESEADAGFAGSDGKSGIASEGELFGGNHCGDKVQGGRLICQILF